MADMLSDGLDWLADELEEHVSKEVTYSRGASLVQLNATIGRTLLKLQDDLGGIRMVWTDRDFIVRTADLTFGAGPVEPNRGDRVAEVDGTTTRTYEVLAPGGEPHWRWSDPHHKMRRIHAKLIRTETE